MARTDPNRPRPQIELDPETLRNLQLVELELLVEVDRICRAHDIPYCIIAGTLLGAVRHGGFIPWDDDADVAMLRADYERFRDACKTELDPAKYYFQDHTVTPGFRWGYGKLRRADHPASDHHARREGSRADGGLAHRRRAGDALHDRLWRDD